MPLTTEQQTIVNYILNLEEDSTSTERTVMVNSVAGS